jgi:hypothetical protein
MSRSEIKTGMEMDTKPDINDTGGVNDTSEGGVGVGIKPIYGFEGIPSLPPKWTYATHEIVCLQLPCYQFKLMRRMRYGTIHLMDRLRNDRWISLN